VSSDKFIFSVPLRWLFVVVMDRWFDGSVGGTMVLPGCEQKKKKN